MSRRRGGSPDLGGARWAGWWLGLASACAVTDGGQSVPTVAEEPSWSQPVVVVPEVRPPAPPPLAPPPLAPPPLAPPPLAPPPVAEEEPPPPSPPPEDHASEALRWTDVACFAYAPDHRGYACEDFASGADSGVGGLVDFEAWEDPDRTAWHGHKSVVLVGADVQALRIVSKEYDHTNDVVRHATATAVLARTARKGYVEPVTRRAELVPGEWTRVAGTWLRFDTHYSEGSASFQQFGSLRVVCRQPTSEDAERVPVVENEGERAVAFWAEGADALAIGFVEVDGGEGSDYYNTAYARVDACP